MPTRAERQALAAQKARAERDEAAALLARLELAATSFPDFVRTMWPVLHPTTPLVWGRHMDVMAHAIDQQLRGNPEYRNLLLEIPPGFNKSIMASVMRPAWMWLHWASRSSTYVSSMEDLAERDSRRTRLLLQSDEYKALQRHLSATTREKCPVCGQRGHPVWTFSEDQNVKINFENTRRGVRQCIGISSKATGKRGDDILFDDIVDAREVREASAPRLKEILDQADEQAAYFESTRINNLKTATRTLIMQPLCEGDPADRRVKEGGWKVICLPIRFDPEHPERCPEDWRSAPGEWLHPERFAEEEAAFVRRKLGEVDYGTQYEMRRRPKDGGIVQASWLRTEYRDDPAALKEHADEVAIVIDTSVKGGEGNDPTSMACWARYGTQKYIVDLVNERMGWLALKRASKAFIARHPEARVKIIEDKASGSQLAEELKNIGVTGVVLFQPGVKDKMTRFKMWAAPAFEAGEIVLPREEAAPWVRGFKDRLLALRARGTDDDDADTTAMVCKRWQSDGFGLVLPRVNAPPKLQAGFVTRWSQKEPGVRYRMGVWAGFALNGATATWGVVLDGTTGLEVSRVVVDGHGEGAAIVAVADEAAYWGAVVRVTGPAAARLTKEVARRRVSVVREVWTQRRVGEVWGVLDRASRDRLVTIRSPELENDAGAATPDEMSPPLWALGLALTGMAPKSVPVTAPRLVLLNNKGEKDDAWTRTSLIRVERRQH